MGAIYFMLLHHRGDGPPPEPMSFWSFLLILAAAIGAMVLALLLGLARIRYGRGEPTWALLACSFIAGPQVGIALAILAKSLKENAHGDA